MRMMSGACAREAAPLIYFMRMPHCRVSAAGLPLIHLTPFIHSFGASPLHLAAGSGQFGCCYYAAGSGRLEIVRLLVSAGADLNIRDV
jgi:hypothetical protein